MCSNPFWRSTVHRIKFSSRSCVWVAWGRVAVAATDAVANSKWVKFQFRGNYLLSHDKAGNDVSKLPNLRTKREVWPLEFVDKCSFEVITQLMGFDSE